MKKRTFKQTLETVKEIQRITHPQDWEGLVDVRFPKAYRDEIILMIKDVLAHSKAETVALLRKEVEKLPRRAMDLHTEVIELDDVKELLK